MSESILKDYYTTPYDIVDSTIHPDKNKKVGYFDKFNFCFLGLQVCVTTFRGKLAVCVRGWYPSEPYIKGKKKYITYDSEWVPVAFPMNISEASCIFREYVDEIISMPSSRFALFSKLSRFAFL